MASTRTRPNGSGRTEVWTKTSSARHHLWDIVQAVVPVEVDAFTQSRSPASPDPAGRRTRSRVAPRRRPGTARPAVAPPPGVRRTPPAPFHASSRATNAHQGRLSVDAQFPSDAIALSPGLNVVRSMPSRGSWRRAPCSALGRRVWLQPRHGDDSRREQQGHPQPAGSRREGRSGISRTCQTHARATCASKRAHGPYQPNRRSTAPGRHARDARAWPGAQFCDQRPRTGPRSGPDSVRPDGAQLHHRQDDHSAPAPISPSTVSATIFATRMARQTIGGTWWRPGRGDATSIGRGQNLNRRLRTSAGCRRSRWGAQRNRSLTRL